MTTEQKLETAMRLLNRANDSLADQPPDANYFRDFYLLTGDHMILGDEGWEPGSCKAALIKEYGADVIRDEVNAPDSATPTAKEYCDDMIENLRVNVGKQKGVRTE